MSNTRTQGSSKDRSDSIKNEIKSFYELDSINTISDENVDKLLQSLINLEYSNIGRTIKEKTRVDLPTALVEYCQEKASKLFNNNSSVGYIF